MHSRYGPNRIHEVARGFDLEMNLYDLNENGFQIIPEALSGENCDALIGLLQTAGDGMNRRQPHLKQPQIAQALIASSIGELFSPPWKIIRSIFFDKTSKGNWSVPWHQDLTICLRERLDAPGFGPWSIKDGLHHVHAPAAVLDPIVTVRIHLDDCGPENGPLRVMPGSHKNGRLNDPSIEKFRGTHTEFACTISKGGVLLMKPLLLHSSSRATNPTHRRILHFEVTTANLPFGLDWI